MTTRKNLPRLAKESKKISLEDYENFNELVSDDFFDSSFSSLASSLDGQTLYGGMNDSDYFCSDGEESDFDHSFSKCKRVKISKEELGFDDRKLQPDEIMVKNDVSETIQVKLEVNEEVSADSSQESNAIKTSSKPSIFKKLKKGQKKGDRIFKCNFCDHHSRTKYLYKIHIETHGVDNNAKFTCNFCPGRFKTIFQMYQHMKRVHKKERGFQCADCEFNATSIPRLNRHKKCHSAEYTKNFKHLCRICNGKFISRRARAQHERYTHGTAKKKL